MDFEKIRALRNRTNWFAVSVGIVTTRIEQGCAEAVLRVRPQHQNLLGIVHGGCLYTLGDVVSGSAAASCGYHCVTTSGEYHYLHAARDVALLKATAREVRRGRRISVFDVEVFGDDVLIGKGTFTHYTLDQQITFDGGEVIS